MIFIILESIIGDLRYFFFLYGLFVEIVFDKGFKFVFGECEIFLKENGKCYMKFVLYYFVFNGEVDRVVCIFK